MRVLLSFLCREEALPTTLVKLNQISKQGIRKEGKTPRTRKQEIDLYKIDQLERDINTETRGSEIALNRSIFSNDIGLATTNRRDQYPWALETYKTIVANFKNSYLGTQYQTFPSDINSEHTFFSRKCR